MHPDLDLILRATRDLFAARRREARRRRPRGVRAHPRLRHRAGPGARRAASCSTTATSPSSTPTASSRRSSRATQRKVWLKSGRLPDHRPGRGAHRHRRQLRAATSARRTSRRRSPRSTSRRRRRSSTSSGCATSAASSSSTSSTWRSRRTATRSSRRCRRRSGRDKAKTNVLRITELGLVEMTRKRMRESLGRMLHEACFYCDGQGFVKTATTVAYEIFREIRREAAELQGPDAGRSTATPRSPAAPGRGARRAAPPDGSLQQDPSRCGRRASYHREQYDLYGRTVARRGPPHRNLQERLAPTGGPRFSAGAR